MADTADTLIANANGLYAGLQQQRQEEEARAVEGPKIEVRRQAMGPTVVAPVAWSLSGALGPRAKGKPKSQPRKVFSNAAEAHAYRTQQAAIQGARLKSYPKNLTKRVPAGQVLAYDPFYRKYLYQVKHVPLKNGKISKVYKFRMSKMTLKLLSTKALRQRFAGVIQSVVSSHGNPDSISDKYAVMALQIVQQQKADQARLHLRGRVSTAPIVYTATGRKVRLRNKDRQMG